jgi:2-dehydro-3-deoxyphosphogalactonate aldolase
MTETATDKLQKSMAALPLVAILRGLAPDEALAIGAVLVEAGFRIIEVPLNSPQPFQSIEALARRFGDVCIVGAGTVLDPTAVARLEAAGGELVVMPHGDKDVIKAAKAMGLACVPGIATPTEAFAALAAGADALKLFPAEILPPAAVKAMLAVLPKGTALLPVGGIAPESMAAYVAAGAKGFGLGSALFKPGMTAADVGERAAAFIRAFRQLKP